MKRFLLVTTILFFTAPPALALKITNLDTVVHTVELAGGGNATRYEIQPGATENITGASQGMLSLLSAQTVRNAKKRVQADGLLSGVIGDGRNQKIPVDPNDIYTIWPGGELRLQGKTKATQGR